MRWYTCLSKDLEALKRREVIMTATGQTQGQRQNYKQHEYTSHNCSFYRRTGTGSASNKTP